ncbi:MAG: KilA-N domain-containing protein [Solobacterium sp.]|nr:KilA-N domain-containing protein [Solobacterium sp.]
MEKKCILARTISLTDIARYRSIEPRITIHNWLRGRDVVEFLGLWETLHNPDFKCIDFDTFKEDAGSNAFVFSIKDWTEKLGAIGLLTKSGRYGGGIYAHIDIAFEFASWVSPEFKLYLQIIKKSMKSA